MGVRKHTSKAGGGFVLPNNINVNCGPVYRNEDILPIVKEQIKRRI